MTINVFGLSLLPPSARKRGAIVKACRAVLKSEKADKKGELNIIILGLAKMRALNKRYLNRSHDTDVIAFNHEADQDFPGEEKPFGDVYISAHQSRRQAKDLKHPVLTEVLTLVIHGTLHLLGYDDGTPRQKKEMFRRQDALLRALGSDLHAG